MLAITNTYFSGGYQVANPTTTFEGVTVSSDEMLLAWVVTSHNNSVANDISSVTFKGVPLSFVAGGNSSTSNAIRVELWIIASPPVGTGDLVVTLAGVTGDNDKALALCRMVSGVGTMTAYALDTAVGSKILSCTVSSAVGDLVIDGGMYRVSPDWISADASQGDVVEYNSDSLAYISSSKAGASPSVTMTWTSSYTTAYWGTLIAVSLSESGGASSATITLSPDPASVVNGGTTQITITRSTAASGNVTYDLSSTDIGVATVPATATILDGQTTGTFDITGVALGSATITATNAADSAETASVDVLVTAVRKLRVLVDAAAAGATGVAGAVWAAPAGAAIKGAEIGEFTGAAFSETLVGGKAELKVDVSEFGGEALTTEDVPAVYLRTDTHTTGITQVDVSIIEE